MSDRAGARGVDWPMASLAPSRQKTHSSNQEPIRTCVGCRERASKADLVRLVILDGTLTVDRDFTVPGRGAYLHPRPDCVESALRRRALPRALRWQGNLNVDTVSEQLTAGVHPAADSSGAVE